MSLLSTSIIDVLIAVPMKLYFLTVMLLSSLSLLAKEVVLCKDSLNPMQLTGCVMNCLCHTKAKHQRNVYELITQKASLVVDPMSLRKYCPKLNVINSCGCLMQWICIDAYSNSCTNEALLPYSDVLQRTLPNGLMGSQLNRSL